MRDLDKALADILAIRTQIAAGTAFRGYGPAAMAVTAALALITTLVQVVWLEDPTAQPLLFFVRLDRRRAAVAVRSSGSRCARGRTGIIPVWPTP